MTLQKDRENLADLEQRRMAIINAMAKISGRFVVQLGRELPERWERIVSLHITALPDAAMDMGTSGLAKLKEELAYLQARAHQVAVNHLSGPSVWAHESDGPAGEDAAYRPEHTQSHPEAQRWTLVSGPISEAEAEVLGLLTPRFGSPEGIWLVSAAGRLGYALEAVIKAYQKLNVQLLEIDGERRTLLREVKAKEAQELWENA